MHRRTPLSKQIEEAVKKSIPLTPFDAQGGGDLILAMGKKARTPM